LSTPRTPAISAKKPPRIVLPPSPNLISTLTGVGRKYNEVAHVLSPLFNFYLVSDPELIQEVLVMKHRSFVKGDFLQRTKKVFGEGLLTSEGEFHHKQRRLVQPAFHSSNIASYAETITAYTDGMLDTWNDGAVMDIHEEMTRLTMAIIAKCLFNEDIENVAADISKSLSDIIEYFNRLSSPFAWLLEKLPTNRKYESAVRKVDRMVYDIIRDRRESGNAGYKDLLALLLEARDPTGAPMSEKQVRDEALILFAAGHETTANALSWTWYLISQNPKVEEKLHEEVDSVLARGRVPSLEDVSKLDFTTKVFTESMRLYPPAWILTRQATTDLTIGEYRIPKGSDVLMSQYVLHHDPRFFEEPEKFNPDRWTKEMRSKLPKFAYFPFGGGPRSCVGEPFAWMEGTLIIARIASRWKLELHGRERVEMLPRITLRPKNGIRMRTVRRS
jgi:cytochrome P450